LSSPPKKRTPKPGSFAAVLEEMRDTARFTQAELGSYLHVSPKTLARWENGQGMPSDLEKHGVYRKLTILVPGYEAQLAPVFGFELSAEPAVPAGHAVVKAALDGAVFEAAVALGAPPEKVRAAAIALLERVALVGVDPRAAAKLLLS
jgi:DNA-binding XRE family transcriptional regulator